MKLTKTLKDFKNNIIGYFNNSKSDGGLDANKQEVSDVLKLIKGGSTNVRTLVEDSRDSITMGDFPGTVGVFTLDSNIVTFIPVHNFNSDDAIRYTNLLILNGKDKIINLETYQYQSGTKKTATINVKSNLEIYRIGYSYTQESGQPPIPSDIIIEEIK